MIATENRRQERLLQRVNKNGYATVEELAEQLNVSAQTIRRDIKKLSDKKLIIRHHGGAGRCSSVINLDYELRQISEVHEKERIAKAIVSHIPDNCTIFISIGTTTEIIAKHLLNKKGLKIITNSLRVAHILFNKKDFEIIVPGGSVKPHNSGITGSSVIDFVKNFRVDYLITSLGAIDIDGTMLDFDLNEVGVIQTVMRTARNIFIAANSIKFQASAAVEITHLQNVHFLFCEKQPPAEITSLLLHHNVELVICN